MKYIALLAVLIAGIAYAAHSPHTYLCPNFSTCTKNGSTNNFRIKVFAREKTNENHNANPNTGSETLQPGNVEDAHIRVLIPPSQGGGVAWCSWTGEVLENPGYGHYGIYINETVRCDGYCTQHGPIPQPQ